MEYTVNAYYVVPQYDETIFALVRVPFISNSLKGSLWTYPAKSKLALAQKSQHCSYVLNKNP